MTAILAPTERRRIDVGPPTEPPTWREVPPIERAWYVLADLPKDPTEIARLLHDLSIKGRRADGEFCPLANYLHWRVPGLTGLHVDGEMVECEQGWFDFDAGDMNALRGFVLLFDDGCFPTLVEHLALPAPERAP
jgi:hypothetical protein